MTASRPKRHHWWPQLQSGRWAGDDGLIHVVKADGSFFKSSPLNIGVEGELYTRFGDDGEKDVEIEEWFSKEIETPFAKVLPKLIAPSDIRTRPVPPHHPDQPRELKAIGFLAPSVVESVRFTAAERAVIDAYFAALLVRNPRYLRRIYEFHEAQGSSLPGLTSAQALKTLSLENMLYVFKLYRDVISRASLGLLYAEGGHEFVFADAGITATEPWRKGPVPFDVHAPLTPTLAVEILPVAGAPNECFIMRCNRQGVSRMNKLALAGADKFVFTRGHPPIDFIRKNFGKPVPWIITSNPRTGGLRTTPIPR